MKNPFEVENVDNSNKVNSGNQDFEIEEIGWAQRKQWSSYGHHTLKSHNIPGWKRRLAKGRCHAISDVRSKEDLYTEQVPDVRSGSVG